MCLGDGDAPPAAAATAVVVLVIYSSPLVKLTN